MSVRPTFELMTEVRNRGGRFDLRGDRVKVIGIEDPDLIEDLRAQKETIKGILTGELCPTCGQRLEIRENSMAVYSECSQEPGHFSGLARQPGSDFLPIPGRSYTVGACEFCGREAQLADGACSECWERGLLSESLEITAGICPGCNSAVRLMAGLGYCPACRACIRIEFVN